MHKGMAHSMPQPTAQQVQVSSNVLKMNSMALDVEQLAFFAK
jgi:hypothetical protein